MINMRKRVWNEVYRVIRKTTKINNDEFLRGDVNITLSDNESAKFLADTFNIADTETTDNLYNKKLTKLAKYAATVELNNQLNDVIIRRATSSY
ncbi:unnamed protein product [Euphydryas editha]|uniref:Uncharacterized protein n=1 Tax=Euphydryas editha TaxID=104508 RepID=A0AAU9TDY2_EUPED|nr:unnamed protein product [Euphydryas editha]